MSTPSSKPPTTIPPERIRWRIVMTTRNGTYARIAPYIEARDAMEWLDEHVPDWTMDPPPREVVVGQTVGLRVCLTGTIGEHRVTRCDVGVPNRPGSPEAAPIKGAFSDGLKRAAVHFGCARELYGFPEFFSPPKLDKEGKPLVRTNDGKTSITAVATVPSYDATKGEWLPPKGGFMRHEDSAEVISEEANIDPAELAAEAPAASNAPAAAAAPQPAANTAPAAASPSSGPACPVHHKPFRKNSRGFYCATKVGEDETGQAMWCQEKPDELGQAGVTAGEISAAPAAAEAVEASPFDDEPAPF